MAYDIYIDGVLLPVAPSKISIQRSGQNKTYNLINDGEINILKASGLQEITLDALLPNVKYPFAKYTSGFQKAGYYVDKLQQLKDGSRPFQFIVSRAMPNGRNLFGTNIKVALEDFTIEDDAGEGFDVVAGIKLKQYRDYGTKIFKIMSKEGGGCSCGCVCRDRAGKTTSPKPKTHNVKKGECLWTIAKDIYGKGSEYVKIYEANRGIIKNPNLIFPGQELIIP